MMSKAAARAVMVQAVNGNPIRLLLRWHHCCFSTAAIFGSIPQSRTIALALLSSSSTTAPVRLLLHTGRLNSKSNCFSTTTPLAATSEPHSLSLSLPALLREAYGAVGAIAIAFLALAAATGTSLSKEETSTAAATPILRTTTQCNGIVGIVGSQENARCVCPIYLQ